MVGRTVIVPADQAVVDTEAGLEGQLALQQNSTNVFVNIYDQAGSLVKTINLGSQEAGMHDFTWDGTDASGNLAEPGIYTVEAMASIDGKNTQMATLLPANVDSVSLGAGGSGEMLLNVAGLGSISLSNVYAIK